MSKGLGVIERAILAEIEQRDRHSGKRCTMLVNSWSLSCALLPDSLLTLQRMEPSRALRQAVVRAMHSFVRKFPQYALIGGQGHRVLYLYEPADPLSALWARLNAHRRRKNPIPRSEAVKAFNEQRDDAPEVN